MCRGKPPPSSGRPPSRANWETIHVTGRGRTTLRGGQPDEKRGLFFVCGKNKGSGGSRRPQGDGVGPGFWGNFPVGPSGRADPWSNRLGALAIRVRDAVPLHRGMTPFGIHDPERHTPDCRYVRFMTRLGF